MKYGLLVKKIHIEKEKIITSDIIRGYSKILGIDYNYAVGYLIRTRNIYTILKGIFYVPSIEERKMNKIEIFHLDALAKALEIKGVKNWYFGLESAIKMNGLTHEYYVVDTVISDKIFRKNPLSILGNKIRFIKLKSKLSTKGIITKKNLKFSDVEKTILDMIYLGKYNGKTDKETLDYVKVYLSLCKKEKLKKYSRDYNKKVIALVDKL